MFAKKCQKPFLQAVKILFKQLENLQVCKFQVGSYSYNMEKMIFAVSQLGFAHTSRYSIILKRLYSQFMCLPLEI